MKRIIIVTILIIWLIISATAVLINIKNDKINTVNLNNNDNQNQVNENIKEKTLNLYGTFNQNDILIIDKKISHEKFYEDIIIKQITSSPIL